MTSDTSSHRASGEPFESTVDGLEVACRGPVLELVISRPERRNALTPPLIRELMRILSEASGSDELRVVSLTGAGGKAFCAGFDIAHIASPGTDDSGAERDLVDDLATLVADLPLPVVAVIDGVAVGAGCDLAVACDIRLGTPSSRFGMPPAKLGLIYGERGVARLMRAVGYSAAKEMLLTGELIDAQRAYEIGLLSRIVPTQQLADAASELLDRIATNAPLSVAGSKRTMNILSQQLPSEAAETELAEIQRRVWSSADSQEGARAHRERRPPVFTGE